MTTSNPLSRPRRWTRPGPTPLLDENLFIPYTINQARDLFDELTAHGTTRAVARSIIATLQTLPDQITPAHSVSLVYIRKELAKLDGPPWEKRDAVAV